MPAACLVTIFRVALRPTPAAEVLPPEHVAVLLHARHQPRAPLHRQRLHVET